MADKEATVYIVDVGRSMAKSRNGRSESDFDYAMRYVWDKITTTISTGRKTAMLGVVALGTDATDNEMAEEDGYGHLSVIQSISQILMPDLRRLRDIIRPSRSQGDAVSALVLALSMIVKHCKKLKWKRKIVLVTNGAAHMDPDPSSLKEIVKKIQEDEIDLVVLGVDFDDPDYGVKEENKSPIKAANETLLSDLVEQCGGLYGTMQQAIDELSIPRPKVTKPTPSYKGQLRLGGLGYDTALCIDVERYPRVMVAKPPSASQFVLKADGAEATHSSLSNLTNVRNAYSYQVQDPEAPGGKKDVERDDLAKGYEYGRTAVHISESDINIVKLETEAAMEIIGFVPKENYERYFNLDTSNIIIAQKTNDKAIIALSSFIHALFEVESYAICRLVTKDMKEPILTVLSPSPSKDYEFLIENKLPFAEDIRPYRFPPLDKIVTTSGQVITQHRNLPSHDLITAMSDFVDKMDLSTFGRDDEGSPAEYMPLEESFSPLLHRIEGAKKYRAVYPTAALPPIDEVLLRYSRQPEEMQLGSKEALKRLMKAADVKRVPPKVKGRKQNREAEKPLSGLDVDELFRKEKRTKISPTNAIPEFKQMLATTENLDAIKDAVKQMTTIIENQIRTSFGDNAYERAIEAIGVMRQEMIELEEPGLYNDALRELKQKIMGEELGGNRKEMWWYVRKNRMGLIDKKGSAMSDVTEEEANAFLTAR